MFILHVLFTLVRHLSRNPTEGSRCILAFSKGALLTACDCMRILGFASRLYSVCDRDQKFQLKKPHFCRNKTLQESRATISGVQAGKMWEATDPHAICGFAVTRETAEALLMVQPTGTFLVRLSSQPGALAIRWALGQFLGSPGFACPAQE